MSSDTSSPSSSAFPPGGESERLGLEALQQAVDRYIHELGVRYFSPLTNTAILSEETGEVARLMARLYGDQSAKAGEPADLGDELADVVFVVCCLANQTGVDLEEAMQANLAKKRSRDRTRHRDNPKLRGEGPSSQNTSGEES